MINEMLYVIIYAVLNCMLFFVYHIKRKVVDIGTLPLFVWSISSLLAIYLFIDNGSEYVILKNSDRITLLPYIYLFSIYLLGLIPVLKIQSNRIQYVRTKGYSNFLYPLTIFFIVVSLLPLIENFFYLINSFDSNIMTGLSDTYDSKKYAWKTWHSLLGKKMETILILFNKLLAILFFYWLPSKKNILFKIFALFPLLTCLLYGFLTASRAAIVLDLTYIIFLYLLLKNTLSDSMQKKLKTFMLLGTSVIFSLILIITYARYNESVADSHDFSVFKWIAIYLGESTLRFNAQMWNIDTYMLGDKCFPGLKSIIGLDTFTNLIDRRNYWEPKIGIQNNVFYTYVGDFFSDFGMIGAILLVLLFILPFRWIHIKHSSLTLSSILYISIWYSVILYGSTYYCYQVTIWNYSLLLQLLVCCILKFLETKNEKS